MKKFMGFIFKLILFFLVYQVFLRLLRRVYDFPAPAFIGRFLDSDLRRKMQPPETVIERSGIKPGMKVLEAGCGSGAFTTAVCQSGWRRRGSARPRYPAWYAGTTAP